MGQDSRGLIAITVSVLVFILWYSYIAPKFWPREETKKQEVSQEQKVVVPEAPEQQPVKEEPVQEKKIAEKVSTLENDYFRVEFTNYGASPASWILKKYTVTKDKAEEPVSMVPATKLSQMPLEITFDKNNFSFPKEAQYELVEEAKGFLRYRWSSGKVIVEKIYTMGENEYDLNLKVVIKNTGAVPIDEQFSLGWTAAVPVEAKKGVLGFLKGPANVRAPLFLINGKVRREANPGKVKKAEFESGMLYWVGIEDRYFISTIIPRGEGNDLSVKLAVFGDDKEKGFYSGVALPESSIASEGRGEYNFTIYAGPKDMQILKRMGVNLDKAIDFGWFTFIAIPILYILKFLYDVFQNYGVAIILLTIIIKILLHPISKKSMKSMKGMKALQPRLKELKEKYKDNKERLNLEMMQLFKTHKVNPMSGCLPMVLQFPVYIALYRVLWNSIELYHAPFFWFYKDLSQPDPYFITPVLLGIAMFLQQKMTPAATVDPAQQKMMMMMPLMFCAFLAFLPVGLVVYILVNTAMSIVQQWMNNNDIRMRDLVRGRIKARA